MKGLNSSAEVVDDGAFPLCEVSGDDMLACVAHQPEIEAEVMDACYLHGKQLLRFEEVVKIGFRVDVVNKTSVGVYR